MNETRKLIESARKILMDTWGLSSQDALRLIKARSMKKRWSLRQVAESIVRGDWKD